MDLRLLELGSNKIRDMRGLEGLAHLQDLWLGRNRITHIAGLSRFAFIKCLSQTERHIKAGP